MGAPNQDIPLFWRYLHARLSELDKEPIVHLYFNKEKKYESKVLLITSGNTVKPMAIIDEKIRRFASSIYYKTLSKSIDSERDKRHLESSKHILLHEYQISLNRLCSWLWGQIQVSNRTKFNFSINVHMYFYKKDLLQLRINSEVEQLFNQDDDEFVNINTATQYFLNAGILSSQAILGKSVAESIDTVSNQHITPVSILRKLAVEYIEHHAPNPVHLHGIYNAVQQKVTLKDQDFVPPNLRGQPTNEPGWRRNVRNALQKMKDKGGLVNHALGYWRLPTPLSHEYALDPNESWKEIHHAAAKSMESNQILLSEKKNKCYQIMKVTDSGITISHMDAKKPDLLRKGTVLKAISRFNSTGGQAMVSTLINTISNEVVLVEFHPNLKISVDKEWILLDKIADGTLPMRSYQMSNPEMIYTNENMTAHFITTEEESTFEPPIDTPPQTTQLAFLPYSFQDLQTDTHLAPAMLNRICKSASYGEKRGQQGQIILYGPPGTGKTHIAEKVALRLVDGEINRIHLAQFHPAYAYEHFIEGHHPKEVDGQMVFKLLPGLLRRVIAKIYESNKRHVIVIDEMNRGDVAQIFGELMYLLSRRGENVSALLPKSGERLVLPAQLSIIGTMNTADRSIAHVDFALRRRFRFFHIEPMSHIIEACATADGQAFTKVLATLMDWVNGLLDEEAGGLCLGHSYFIGLDTFSELEEVWNQEVFPLLEDYLDYDKFRLKKFGWNSVKTKCEQWRQEFTVTEDETTTESLSVDAPK